MQTRNRFSELQEMNDEGQAKNDSGINKVHTEPKPPPIFVVWVKFIEL